MATNFVLGLVTECLPNLLYRVNLEEGGREVTCHLSGKMRLHKIRVIIGDRVEVVLDPYNGKATNRIISRLK